MGKQHEAYLQFYRTANELHFDGKLTKEIEDIANRLELFEITPEQAVSELNQITPVKATSQTDTSQTFQHRLKLFQCWSDLIKEDDSPEDLAGK